MSFFPQPLTDAELGVRGQCKWVHSHGGLVSTCSFPLTTNLTEMQLGDPPKVELRASEEPEDGASPFCKPCC